MKRAIVVYLEKKRDLLLQFGCLYKSFRYIKSKDTDLIVYGSKDALQFISDIDCIKVEYNPPPTNYPYLNSIRFLTDEKSSILNRYKFILRTDLDTFLTPSWNSFYPNNFTVGRGHYVQNEFVREKLLNLSHQFGLDHKGMHNIGTSHYGDPELICSVCEVSTVISIYLLTNDFKEYEGLWPGWYKGVITMYSNEIAINHLLEKITINSDLLDYSSSSNHSIKNHPHIHCLHTTKPFSKFHFSSGLYNHVKMDSLNIEKVNDYCMFISLKAVEEFDFMKSLLFTES